MICVIGIAPAHLNRKVSGHLAAVELFGIINWSTMLKSSDPRLNEYLKALLGDPAQNAKIYEADSPITYIRGANAPLLVWQGDNDPRVPKEEAQQVVDILKKEGRAPSTFTIIPTKDTAS